jgi:16S rRNA (cytosine1402-N4)-methyltransferase
MEYHHVPVMLKEVLELLDPKKGENYIDGTFGGGGYSSAIIERCAPGKVLAIEADPLAVANFEANFDKNKKQFLILVHDNFANLSKIVQDQNKNEKKLGLDGLVLDLGLSSAQLADRDRGFSFKHLEAPLDMAFGAGAQASSVSIINTWQESELLQIFREYGEEPFAKPIVRGIIEARKNAPIMTVGNLLAILERSLPTRVLKKPGIHYATRVFQALRIATNDEMSSLRQVLEGCVELLKPEARIVVVSYHSLEDRIVKQFFRQQARECVCPPELPICNCDQVAKLEILTKKAITPSMEEVQANPRARSAKLRAAKILKNPKIKA